MSLGVFDQSARHARPVMAKAVLENLFTRSSPPPRSRTMAEITPEDRAEIVFNQCASQKWEHIIEAILSAWGLVQG